MLDIHSHILPGMDDGPETLAESLDMGRLYARAGFTAVVATPHGVPGTRWMPEGERIIEAVQQVTAGLSARGLLLKVYPGMEIALDPLVPRLLGEGRLLTLGKGPYLLLECPFQRLPLGWEDIIKEAAGMGCKILLAHPERCAELVASPEMVLNMVAGGAYTQVNWESLVGLNGALAQKLVLTLARSGGIHCLATDSHDRVHRSPAMVALHLNKAQHLLGKGNLERLMVDNPRRVLQGDDLVGNTGLEVSATAPRRRWFRFQ